MRDHGQEIVVSSREAPALAALLASLGADYAATVLLKKKVKFELRRGQKKVLEAPHRAVGDPVGTGWHNWTPRSRP